MHSTQQDKLEAFIKHQVNYCACPLCGTSKYSWKVTSFYVEPWLHFQHIAHGDETFFTRMCEHCANVQFFDYRVIMKGDFTAPTYFRKGLGPGCYNTRGVGKHQDNGQRRRVSDIISATMDASK